MAGMGVFRAARDLYHYLWRAEETAAVRGRAIAWGVVALAGIPSAIALIPLPASVYADGVVTFADERVVRPLSPGFLKDEGPEPGAYVQAGQQLAALANDQLHETLLLAETEVKSAESKSAALTGISPVQAAREALRVDNQRISDLTMLSPIDGFVVQESIDLKPGSYVPAGTPLFTVCGGQVRVRTYLPQSAFASVSPSEGQRVFFRPDSDPASAYHGTVIRVAPQAQVTRRDDWVATDSPHHASPPSGTPVSSAFEIEVILDDRPEVEQLHYGMTGTVRFQAESQTILKTGIRAALRFVQKLLASN
jgi:hypothetical protein